jgi:F-box/WD-40 domain protein MET30
VRNFRNGGRFFLRGHEDWVNQVVLWDGKSSPTDLDPTAPPRFRARQQKSPGLEAAPGDEIDVGQMLFSASDDLTIKLWDLTTQQCLRTFTGHKGQIQSLKLLMVDKRDDEEQQERERRQTSPINTLVPASHPTSHTNVAATELAPTGFDPILHNTLRGEEITPRVYVHDEEGDRRGRKERSPNRDEKCAVLVTGSLDGTVKVWDVETGREKNTLFGHIEGVWAVDMDALRLASGSHDRTIKVWDRQSGNCVQTLVGHRGAVTSLQLSDDMIVSGSDDGDIMAWSFAPQQQV